jgi:amino acid permease
MENKEKLRVMPEEDDECQPLLGGNVQEKVGEMEWEVRLPQGKTSPFGAVFIIVNAALGAGLLTFPFAFHLAGGVLPALSVTLFLLVWIALGLIVLAHLAETLQASTYEEVVGRACGKVAKAIVDTCIIVYTFGTSITFLVVIGDQLQDCDVCSSACRWAATNP